MDNLLIAIGFLFMGFVFGNVTGFVGCGMGLGYMIARKQWKLLDANDKPVSKS